jgi:hypothetical protein
MLLVPRQYVDFGDVGIGSFWTRDETGAFGVFGDGFVLAHFR